MVHLSRVLLTAPRGLSRKTKFLDRIRVYVRGGAGGQGYVRYGGLGGDGGNVVMVAKSNKTLLKLAEDFPEKRFIAKNGADSKRLLLLGDNGEDLVVEVPTGVVLSLDNGKEIADLNADGETVVVAKGGAGGGPNNDFRSKKGETRSIRIDLKLLADVGLVGFPNAGKSTLLCSMSRAKPKVADYPFTTLRPHLGVTVFDDNRRITIADLPGLIEGAHMNIGMGHFFLKHVERTKVLLVVVDAQGFVLNRRSTFRTAFETIVLLNKELEMYKPELLDKPQVLLINKMDTECFNEKYEETLNLLKNCRESMDSIPEELQPNRLFDFKSIIPISASLGENIDTVKQTLRKIIDEENRIDKLPLQNKLNSHIDFHSKELSNTFIV
ncbi:hypothetical protein EB796_022799 [Bugula neritina]|uniref:GTPBP10 n=1 Tax=Bugula neritina TaxID=10212 RepID=A0A7J7IZU6_BUGNE|nr:hypothetical protein EB796_022799 [Bugula neritina]